MKFISTLCIVGIIFLTNTLHAQNVGIGQASPLSKLDVKGNAAIGLSYSGVTAAPANGAIIEGNVGIGTPAPAYQLHVLGSTRIDGDFIDQEVSGGSSTVVQNITYNSAPVALNTAIASIAIIDGNGVNNSAVLITGYCDVWANAFTWLQVYGVAAYKITLQRATNAAFTVGLTNLSSASTIVGMKVSDFNNGLGSAGGNYTLTAGLAGNCNVSYVDMFLVAGTTYYYRLWFTPLYLNVPNGGGFFVFDRSVSAIEIKR